MMKKNKAWTGVITVITVLVMLATGTVSIAESVSGMPTTAILASSSKAESSNSSSKKAKSVSVTGSKYVAVGKTIALTAKVSPEKADQSVVWTSSDKKIATVTSKGKVKGIKAGTVKITATSKSNPKVSKTWKVTVMKKAVTKVAVSGDVDTLDLSGKKAVTLKATASPSKAAQSFEWKSSDARIATVTEKGKVTARSTGKVKITASATDGSKKKQTITITIIDSKSDSTDTTTEDSTIGERESEESTTSQGETVNTSAPKSDTETVTTPVLADTVTPSPVAVVTESSNNDSSEVTVTPAPATVANTPASTTETSSPEKTQGQETITPAPTTTMEYTRVMTQIFGELIPYETTYIDDDTMYVDDPEIVVTSGLEGKKETEWKVYFMDDVEVNRVLVGITTTKEPTNKVVKHGTKQHDIQVKTETREETIPPGITYIDDDTMYVDDPEVTVSDGATGSKTVTLDVTYVDGIRADEKIVSETITTAASDKQIRRGTKEHVYTSDTDTIAWGKAENGNDIKTTYKTYYKDGEVISSEPYTITEYEYVYIDYPSSGAVRTEPCDNIAKEWAMAIAKGKIEPIHTPIQRIESLLCTYEDLINNTNEISRKLKVHSDVSVWDIYGVGVVEVQTTWVSNGYKIIPKYIACAVGYYQEADENGWYYRTETGEIWSIPE